MEQAVQEGSAAERPRLPLVTTACAMLSSSANGSRPWNRRRLCAANPE